jgi:hypothetical protein
MQKLMSYNCHHVGGDNYVTECIAQFVPHYGTRSFNVVANKAEGKYECECCKMQRDGILCCHILKVLAFRVK